MDTINKILYTPVNESNILPKPIKYIDIDTTMTDFIDKNFKVEFGEQKIKTFFFAQQRMSEFTKTWEMVDENHNILPNFKIVTRENNPRPGTMHNGLMNIPGDHYFYLGTFEVENGDKKVTRTCKMKQPYCVDIIYNIKFVTNRFNLLNELNSSVNELFKAKQSYINVNGYFMPVTLEDINDESDYDLDQRKIFIQNYQLKVAGYIINENDIIFEDNITKVIVSINTDNINKPHNIINKDNNIEFVFPRKSKTILSFKSDNDYDISNIIKDNNILSYRIKINGELVENDFEIKKYDRVDIVIERISKIEISKITLITK